MLYNLSCFSQLFQQRLSLKEILISIYIRYVYQYLVFHYSQLDRISFPGEIKNPTDGKKEVNRSGEQKEVNLFNQEFFFLMAVQYFNTKLIAILFLKICIQIFIFYSNMFSPCQKPLIFSKKWRNNSYQTYDIKKKEATISSSFLLL